jgi:ABC-type polysaccharide/polyol phosphate export permease
MARYKLGELFAGRGLLWMLVRQQLTQRYEGSLLGYLWALLNPVLVYCSFTFVFSQLNHWDVRDYGIYFFSGYLVWSFFSNSCLSAADSIVANSVYVTRIYAPRALFPLASVAVNLIDWLASFLVLLVMAAALGKLSWTLLFVPVALALTLTFVTGAALLCAWWNVILRDFRHLLSSLFFVWFFCSPILWKSSDMPVAVQILLRANPIVPFLRLFQAPIWGGQLPGGLDLGIAAMLAGLSLFAGFQGFIRSEHTFYYFL